MLKLSDPRNRKHPSDSRRFIEHADSLVDEILEPTRFQDGPPPRFLHLEPVRFGRVRLFLSKFIGRAAWRTWVTL